MPTVFGSILVLLVGFALLAVATQRRHAVMVAEERAAREAVLHHDDR